MRGSGLDVTTYSDAGLADTPNDRLSMSRTVITLGGVAVSWATSTQRCVTLSTAETEYVALGEGVEEDMFMGAVSSFICPEQTRSCVRVFEDNQGVIALAESSLSSARSKHIDVWFHFVRELFRAKKIDIQSSELGKTPEPGGLEDFDSGPLSPLPLLGRGIPHRRRATPLVRSVTHGGKCEWGSMGGENLPAPTTAPQDVVLSSESNETSAYGDISVEGSETSSSDESRPGSMMMRTAERQLESNFLGRRDVKELEPTRAQTRALNQGAAGLASMFGPDEVGKLIHGSCCLKEVARKSGELPKFLVREAGPEPVPYPAAFSSQYSDVWMEVMRTEFDGLVAASTFAELSAIPEGCKIVDATWLYKWKGGSHGVVDRAKARMVAMGYSQVEEVDYLETFAPTVSATSDRLVAAMAYKLDWDLRHLDVDQAFIQSKMDTDIYLRLPPGGGSVSGKVVLLNKALYGLKQSRRAWYQLLSSTLVECDFEQCLVDLCVFRLMVAGDVVAMMVFHVVDIKVVATEVTEVVVSALNQRFPPNISGR